MAQILALILGACIGSFLNVVIYRLPAGLSLIHPPSHCPKCKNLLKPWHNVPIVGWLWLGGRCAYCRTPIPWRYPAVELLTGLLFAFTVGHFPHGSIGVWIGYGLFLSWLLALALIDLDTMLLPDPLTKSGLVAGVLFHLVIAYTDKWNPVLGQTTTAYGSLLFSIGGMVLGIWLVDIVRGVGSWALGVEAMGAGDPRLVAMMGAWLGWERILLVIFLGSAIGLLFSALIGLRSKQPFPFGPSLALAGMVSLWWGADILRIYLHWVGLA
jgi:leader peptidase (prepilin peptidase)/N-methyltransferase